MFELGRSWSLRVGAGVAVLALLALGAATARAGTYTVHACGQEASFANNSWHASASRGMLAYTKCPTRGDPIRGMVVRNEARDGEVPRGARALMRFTAPAGARLAGVEYDWDGRRVDGEWSIGLASGDGGRWLAGCRAGRPSVRSGCELGRPGPARERLGLPGLDSIRLEASCGRSGGCETRPTGDRRTGRSRARLRLSSASVRVEDATRPRLSVSGELVTADRWLRGTRALEVGATDNVGIKAATLAIDGVRRTAGRRKCDYTRPVPCGQVPTRTHRVDTARLRDGRHLLSVEAVDAASNRAVARRIVQVDNHAPERVRDLRVDGGEDVRSTNSFDVRWTPPPRQAAPIARTHYRLCPLGGSSDARACTTGTRAGGSPSIAGLSVPGRGDYALRVWLEDAAGNVDPQTASTRVRLRFDDRLETRLRAGILDEKGRLSSGRTVPFGARALTRGTLTSATGQAVGDQRVEVLSRTRGSAGYRHVATAVTDRSGRFEHLAARGPSRTLRFAYPGSERHQPSSDDASLGVRASSTIRASRSTARNGDRVRFSGRLLGKPVPAGGKLVELQARYRERWRAFVVERSDGRGEWSRRYRFGGTRGVVTYPFRAVIRREADYPYELGRSDVMKVRVDGR